jgi:hypothetical protein
VEHRQADPEVLAEFRKRRVRQYIAIVPAILSLVVVLIAGKSDPRGIAGVPMSVLGPVCFGLIFAVVIFSFINWRCPACNAYLGRGGSPTFCRKCGERLQG